MGIADYVRDTVLAPRLRQKGCLVVYDPETRYRDICLSLASEDVRIVDASESSIESRELAIETLSVLTDPGSAIRELLVYVPATKPGGDEERQGDPFAVYAACGAVFPDTDADEYLNLCLRSKPDNATEIRHVFDAPGRSPTFAIIDAIGHGASWPQLRAVLGVTSVQEILLALLLPSSGQLDALKEHEGWQGEAREFLCATLSLTLKTKGKTWNAIADETWRFLLFSEFAFDLPVPLPDALAAVPRAPSEAQPIIDSVCEALRQDERMRGTYVDRARSIESELGLAECCSSIEDVGIKDTFPFEERTFLKRATRGIVSGSPDMTRGIVECHSSSVWMELGENRSQWNVVHTALDLIEACVDLDRQVPDYGKALADLVRFYVSNLREADQVQREFEQAVAECPELPDEVQEAIDVARARYRRLTEKVQAIFARHVATEGWPVAGRASSGETFDRHVACSLKEGGTRVAYIVLDALRYELGVILQRQLADEGKVELQASCAQLPSITPVGMAALLPGAASDLSLGLDAGSLALRLGQVAVSNVTARMSVLSKLYGDRFSEALLAEFVKGKAKTKDVVDLLVLRSTEIDAGLEATPEAALSMIPTTLKLVRAAVHKVRGMGFRRVVIATDHGFYLNTGAEAGDVCAKPPGSWPVNAHDRMLLGDGTGDANNIVMGASRLGIRGEFAQAAFPSSLAPYAAGHVYFHGGVSLQELVIPVIVLELAAKAAPPAPKMTVTVSYRGGMKKITTRVPILDLLLTWEDLFSSAGEVAVALEAQTAKGAVVGEAKPGANVDPADRTVRLVPGHVIHVVLGMDPEFEGRFSVKAFDPATRTTYDAIDLETDYTV